MNTQKIEALNLANETSRLDQKLYIGVRNSNGLQIVLKIRRMTKI